LPNVGIGRGSHASTVQGSGRWAVTCVAAVICLVALGGGPLPPAAATSGAWLAAGAPADAGDVLIYTSPVLTAGTHTFKLRNTGRANPASVGTRVCVDRVDIVH
jgi:hypothetical protein